MSLRTGTGIRAMDASKKLDYMSALPYGELEKVLRATNLTYLSVGRHSRGYWRIITKQLLKRWVSARERLRQLDRSKDNNNHQKNNCSVIL